MTESTVKRRVAAVARRLTLAPTSSVELSLIYALCPGKCARWIKGFEKRFLIDLYERSPEQLSLAQRRTLYRLARRHSHRLGENLRADAFAWRETIESR